MSALPGQPITAHLGMPDPAAVEGDDPIKARAFVDTMVAMRRRLELLLALPLRTLEAQAIRRQVQDIGSR